MDPELLRQIFVRARNARTKGVLAPQIAQFIQEQTDGQFSTIEELAQASAQAASAESPGLFQQSDVERIAVEEGRSLVGGPEAAIRNLLQGITLGLSERPEAAARSLLPGETFKTALEDIRNANRIAAQRPGATGTIAAGGLPLGVLTGGATGAGGQSLLRAGVRGGLLGAAEGAAADIGFSEPGEEGLGLGTALGAGIGLLGPVIAPAVRSARGRVRLDPEARDIASARATLGADLADANVRPSEALEVFDELSATRPGDVVGADTFATGPTALRRSTNQSIELRTELQRELTDRGAGSAERLADDVQGLTGFPDVDVRAAKEAAVAQRSVIAREVYGPLEEAFPDVRSAELDALLDGNEVRNFFRDTDSFVRATDDIDIVAEELGGLERFGSQIDELMAGLDTPSGPASRNLRQIQELRDTFFDAIESNVRRGRPRRAQDGRNLIRKLDEILEGTDDVTGIVPGLREANNAFRIQSEIVDGFQSGVDAARSLRGKGSRLIEERWNGRNIERHIESLAGNPEAQRTFRMGMTDELVEELLLQSTNRNSLENAFANAGGELKRRFIKAFPSEDAATEFLRRAEIEDTFQRTLRGITANSTTAAQFFDATRLARDFSFSGFRGLAANAASTILATSPATIARRANILGRAIGTRGPRGRELFEFLLEGADANLSSELSRQVTRGALPPLLAATASEQQ